MQTFVDETVRLGQLVKVDRWIAGGIPIVLRRHFTLLYSAPHGTSHGRAATHLGSLRNRLIRRLSILSQFLSASKIAHYLELLILFL